MKKRDIKKKDSRYVKTAMLFFGSIIIGVILGVLAILITSFLLRNSSNDGFYALGMAILGFFIGYLVGVALSLFFLKKLLKIEGSYLFSMIGLIIGTAVFSLLASPLGFNSSAILFWGMFLILPSAFGILGLHSKELLTKFK